MPIFQTVLKIRKHLNSYYHQRICLNCPSHVKIFDPCSLLIFLLDKILDDHIEHRFGAARSQSLRRPCWSCPQRFGWGRRWSWIGGGGGVIRKKLMPVMATILIDIFFWHCFLGGIILGGKWSNLIFHTFWSGTSGLRLRKHQRNLFFLLFSWCMLLLKNCLTF